MNFGDFIVGEAREVSTPSISAMEQQRQVVAATIEALEVIASLGD